MDKMERVGPSGLGGVVMWPRRVYSRKKRAGERLNLTPKPDPALPGKTEAPPPGLKGLRKITEKEELNRPRGSSSQLPSQLSVTGRENLQENDSPGKETPDEKKTPLSESVTHDFEIDSCSSSSELVSGLTLEHDVSSWSLSCSDTDSYTRKTEESRSSFSSPELFRGSDCLDWEHPMLEEYKSLKNSTLLDTSKAVTIEKAPQLANLSAILSSSSEDYEKCHRNIGMTLEAPHISPVPQYTSNLASENAASEVIFAGKTGPPTTKKTKKKPEKESEDRGPQVQTALSSGHLDSKAPFSHHSLPLEIVAMNDVLLPQTLETVLKKSFTPPDKQSKALLTSTPSSDTADFVIDLSPVQNVSFEELFPNVSNYVNSSEIVPVSSWQESSSNEFPSYASELCCIIKASPGTRQIRSKDATVNKNCSPPKDVPPDIIMKMNGRT
ncbi:meiosis-specific kinetochore protein [Peromyscus leucopus]|uniref:meiosis-specific kinetochore protein n=1 Tax=Peromyscus leucopus TaxID=10041 RepID=UPI00188586FA|nr:meiosis-specific kinetochore protein [Peromyscus leucopus]